MAGKDEWLLFAWLFSLIIWPKVGVGIAIPFSILVRIDTLAVYPWVYIF
jgi:hypothetical protein